MRSLDKFFLKSKTVIGTITAVIPTLAPVFGLSFGADDAAMISATWDAVITAVGGVFAIFGRFKAGGIRF